MTQHTEVKDENSAPCGEGQPVSDFRAVLEYIEGTGEARIIAHQRDGIAEFGVVGWAMEALESDFYLAAKRGLMAEERISKLDLGDMTAAARAVFEARVFDRLRTEYAFGVSGQQKIKHNGKRATLCLAVPLPDP